MSLFSLLLLSVALSIDCFTVCLIFGMQRSALHNALKPGAQDPYPSLSRSAVQAGLMFAIAHIIMLVLGWFLGYSLHSIISRFDHWVAFALLSIIGLKTFIESFSTNHDNSTKVHAMFHWKTMLLLSLAVSIDAFAIGISLNMIQVSLTQACIWVPIAVFIISIIGVMAGYYAHRKMQKISLRTINMIGGLVLIGIGVRILVEHLA